MLLFFVCFLLGGGGGIGVIFLWGVSFSLGIRERGLVLLVIDISIRGFYQNPDPG